MSTTSGTTAAEREQTRGIVGDYVRSKKGWAEGDYHLEFLREEGCPDAPVLVWDAVHHDDLKEGGRGPSRSVQLHVALKRREVVKELAYQ